MVIGVVKKAVLSCYGVVKKRQFWVVISVVKKGQFWVVFRVVKKR